jgi:tetratricopeptide (TPR) repeat protein
MTTAPSRPRGRRRSVVVAVLCLLILAGLTYFVFYPSWTGWRQWRAAQEALDDYDLPRAREILRDYLATRPRDAEGHFLLARTTRRAGDYDEAVRLREKAARLGAIPELIELERQLQEVQQIGVLGQTGELLKMYAHRRHPEEKYVLEALFKGDRGTLNMNRATVWLNLWVERFPDDWLPRLWRGEILESFAHFEAATADFQRVLELKPGRDEALLHLGQIALLDRGRYADAQRYLGQYLVKHPDDPQALLGLARCQKGQGELDAAAATSRRILQKDAGHAEAAQMLGSIELEGGRLEEALRWLRLAERGKADEGETAHQLSLVLRRLGKSAEADAQEKRFQKIDAANRALEKNLTAMLKTPRDPALRHQMGVAHLTLGHEEQAVKWFLSALYEDPAYKPSHQALADYYARRTDPESVRLAAFHRRQAE